MDVSSLRNRRQSPRAPTEGRPDTRSRKWFAGPDGFSVSGWPSLAVPGHPPGKPVGTNS